MGEVAAAAKIPFVDLFEPSRYLMDETKGPNLTTNGIHLNEFGYWAISRIMFENLVEDESSASPKPWHLSIDAKTKTSNFHGVEISGIARLDSQLTFTVKEESGPTLPPPTDQELPPPLDHQRDTLSVVGLKSGDYTLSVDGQFVVTANHQAWAEGVPIDSSPTHKEAEAFREAVNDKNLQFTYSWKALNQVHIVGERRASPSGRALPAEVMRFNEITDQRDDELRGSLGFKTRQWRLVREDHE